MLAYEQRQDPVAPRDRCVVEGEKRTEYNGA